MGITQGGRGTKKSWRVTKARGKILAVSAIDLSKAETRDIEYLVLRENCPPHGTFGPMLPIKC